MSSDVMEALQRALDGVADAFRDAPADGGSIYAPPPDDEYEALVHEFEFLSGDWGVGLKVNYQITESQQYSGRIVGDMFGIRPDRIQWLKGFLSRLGVNVEELDVREIRPGSEVLNGLLDTPVLIRIKRNRRDGQEFVNVYLQRKLGEPGSAGGGFTPASDLGAQQGLGFETGYGRAQGATDDDIPF